MRLRTRRRLILAVLCLCTVTMLPCFGWAANDDPDDQYWGPLTSNDSGVGDGSAYAFAVYENNLVVGGDFVKAGGNVCPGIARWDGATWHSLGAGLKPYSQIRALTVFDTLLVVAGQFYNAGGISNSNHIARWTGSSWLSPMQGGSGPFNGLPALSLGVFRGGLIVGGDVFLTSHPDWHGILHWDDTVGNWIPLGGSTPGQQKVWALFNFGNDLIAGGDFQQIAGTTASRIARWNGTNWSSIGAGIVAGDSARVYALVDYQGELIAGGNFGIMRWDGVHWLPLGPAIEGVVLALQVHNHELIAGGQFSTLGGTPAANIARWNGSIWQPMGSGITGNGAQALVEYQGRLIVGGSFGSAGGKSVVNIAAWYKPCCVGSTGNVDCDPANGVDISDLSAMIDNLYISFAPLCCKKEANVDGSVDGNIDISDLSALIDYLYISFTPPAACN